ncbi:MAG: polyphenol oxidase family protein [Deltaproteobacteria bacterium]|jgi:YfiH family protein|nr:polyphenol oxidase family protein [Deltaproteobacteria bacterium]
MEIRRHRGLTYYAFEILAPYPRLKHGVFARYGPPETGGELTFSFRPDLPAPKVLTSLSLAEEALGLGPALMVGQTHSANVYYGEPARAGRPRGPQDLPQGYDALVAMPGQSLLIKLADCQGVLLFHPKTEALALVHNGWRGTRQNILGKTVKFLSERLFVPPAELVAAVSPSLGPCCAEFLGYRTELPEEFWPYQNPANHYFDFWAIAKAQLAAAGLKPESVQVAGLCTKCHPDFYSHRRGDKGRFAFMAGVSPNPVS